jgi:AAA+ ATPase superfamily predicted ATPase
MALIGRHKEIHELRDIYKEKNSVFVAVYGRRRVGKTYLIREAFDQPFDFQCTGLANANLSTQLMNFHMALLQCYPHLAPALPATDWLSAFQQLIVLLNKNTQKRKLVFLDELPWMDTAQSGFIPALEHFWNSWASTRKDIVLIVCGSAAGWMISNLINSKGGLHNRVTHRIRLQSFTLEECELFFKSKQAVYDRFSTLLLYMVMGGIPFYLEQVRVSDSAAQNINRLCFETDGLLRTEFDNLYRSLFNKAEKHTAVIELLSKKVKGLTRKEIIAGTKISDGGTLTKVLNELGESNFIRRYSPYRNKEKNSLYQLTDCYSLFYLKWIKNSSDLDANTWINQLDSPRQRIWAGYAFEQACLAHIPQIKKALGITGVQTSTSSWISTNSKNGAQIDLIIDRRDQVINICEMKFSINDFAIDKKYSEELKNKLKVFREETGTRKSLFLTLITSFGLKKNTYSSMVQNELTMDVLFEKA